MDRPVLIIDDEASIITIVQVALEVTAGWQVLSATSGKEGVAIATAKQPDAIILDVNMPKQDGKAVLKLLQAKAETQNIPVIFLTAQARGAEQTALKALGGRRHYHQAIFCKRYRITYQNHSLLAGLNKGVAYP